MISRGYSQDPLVIGRPELSEAPWTRVLCDGHRWTRPHELYHEMSVCPADGIAMYPRRDGLGAHFGAMMRVYAHARESQRTFCQKRWYSMEHAEGDAEAYAADMFRFVGGEYFGPEALPSTPEPKSDAPSR